MAASKTKKTGKALTQTDWNDIFLRDSLDDTGTIPRPGSTLSASPDVICTQQQQVDPVQFTQNYDQSPGQDAIANQYNFMYVRGKNLGTQPSGGTVYLYWSRSSLLLWPEQWIPNAMKANIGGKWERYNTLPQVNGGEISVTQTPFTWMTPATPPEAWHYCTIGAISTTAHPWNPSELPSSESWDDFVIWLCNNGNICWRNITVVSNPNQLGWDRLDLVSLPGKTPAPLLVMAQCTNVPVGTTVMLQNDQLGINTTETTTSQNQTIYSKGVTCPAGYNGYIGTLAQLAAGQTWPTGATITTTLLFGTVSSRPVARFAHNFGADEKNPKVMQAKRLAGGGRVDGVLVAVGNCSTRMQPTS